MLSRAVSASKWPSLAAGARMRSVDLLKESGQHTMLSSPLGNSAHVQKPFEFCVTDNFGSFFFFFYPIDINGNSMNLLVATTKHFLKILFFLTNTIIEKTEHFFASIQRTLSCSFCCACFYHIEPV